MPLTNISAYRIAGFKFTDQDFDPNADIEISKIATRTIIKTVPATAFSGPGLTRSVNGIFGGFTIPDPGGGELFYSFKLPAEYVSGDITVRVLWSTAATSGNLYLLANYVSIIPGEDSNTTLTTVTNTDAANGTASRLNEITLTLVGSNFASGDNIGINIYRTPAHGSDTLGADIIVHAISFEFTGRA